MGQELATRSTGMATLSVDELVGQVVLIQEALGKVMKDGEHYGVIPGTDKPTLLKPGAEKLCLLFRLAPDYDIHREWDGAHMTVEVSCRLTHIPTGNFVGAGEAMASTKEAKHAYRNAKRVCPTCGNETIIKGKAEYGGGWLCWKKQGGCGAQFQDGDTAIESQEVGKKDNPDLADTYNTVTKMGCKRALVAAVLNATAASDIFSQDVEDLNIGKPVEEYISANDLEDLQVLIEQAAEVDKDIWSDEAVVDAAKRKYQRPIASLSGLTPQEGHDMTQGVKKWLDKHAPAEPADAEVVETDG